MVKTEKAQARVDAWLEADAEAVLPALGLTASGAIRLFYRQVAIGERFPPLISIPVDPIPAALNRAPFSPGLGLAGQFFEANETIAACRGLKGLVRFVIRLTLQERETQVVLGYGPLLREVGLGPDAQRRLVAGDGAAEVFSTVPNRQIADDVPKNILPTGPF